MELELHDLGPNLYHWSDNGEYGRWLKEHPDSSSDVMTISCVGKEEWERNEEKSQLEPCEILTEEEWLQGGLTPWVDEVTEEEVLAVHVDGTQEVEILSDKSFLENPLHFKTTSTGIIVGEDVKDYPHVPTDWYRNTTEQSHVDKADWNHIEIRTKTSEM